MGKRALWPSRRRAPDESDDELIQRVRGGDSQAFGELYRRHRVAAESTARWLLRSRSEVDDVVSDAFAGVLAAIRSGHGPRDNFRGYLLASVRNGCRSRWQRIVAADRGNRADVAASPMFEDPERYVEADTVARAFASLSPRWQQTLWLTEVEQRSAAEVAGQLRLAPNATAALTHRAREAFATAYLAEHVGATPNEACERHAPRLAAYVRDQLTDAQHSEVERHLIECPHCQQAVRDLRDLNASLRTLAPVTGSNIAGPLTVGTSMGAASTGLLSSGLLLKGAMAILLVAPVFVDLSDRLRDGPVTSDDGEIVLAKPSPPPLEAVNVPVGAASTEPPATTTAVATTVGEPSVRRPPPAAVGVTDQPATVPPTTDARVWDLPTSPLDGPLNHVVNPLVADVDGRVVGALADIALGPPIALVDAMLATITALPPAAEAIAIVSMVLSEHPGRLLAAILGTLADLTTATIDRSAADQPPTSTAPPIDPTSNSAGPTTTLPTIVTTPPQRQVTAPAVTVSPSVSAPPSAVPPVSVQPVTVAPVTVPPITVAPTTLPQISAATTTLPNLPG